MKRLLPCLMVVLLFSDCSKIWGGEPSATVNLSVKIVDAEGQPVPGLVVAHRWSRNGYWGDAKAKGRMVPGGWQATSDEKGEFQIKIARRRLPRALLTYDKEQKRGAVVVLEEGNVDKPITLKLAPLVTVRGKLWCEALKKSPTWANNYIYAYTSDELATTRLATSVTRDGHFEFKLPPGVYRQDYFGEEVKLDRRLLDLDGKSPLLELGTVKMERTLIVKRYGKTLPAWAVKEARGVGKDVKIEDYRGRWLFIFYWAHW